MQKFKVLITYVQEKGEKHMYVVTEIHTNMNWKHKFPTEREMDQKKLFEKKV